MSAFKSLEQIVLFSRTRAIGLRQHLYRARISGPLFLSIALICCSCDQNAGQPKSTPVNRGVPLAKRGEVAPNMDSQERALVESDSVSRFPEPTKAPPAEQATLISAAEPPRAEAEDVLLFDVPPLPDPPMLRPALAKAGLPPKPAPPPEQPFDNEGFPNWKTQDTKGRAICLDVIKNLIAKNLNARGLNARGLNARGLNARGLNGPANNGIIFDPEWRPKAFANFPNMSFAGGVAGPGGKIYFMPFRHPSVLIYDTENEDHKLIELPQGNGGLDHFKGGVLATNECIYCIPFDADYVAKIDTKTDKVAKVKIPAGFGGEKKAKWRGGVLAPNGLIYCVPFKAEHVLVIDPTVDAFRLLKHRKFEHIEYHGACLTPDGSIIFIPHHADQVLKMSLPGEQFQAFGVAPGVGAAAYSGGVLGVDGCVYALPLCTNHVLRIDTKAEKVEVLNLGNNIVKGNHKWMSGALGWDGRIYCSPHNANTILVIDTNEGSPDYNQPFEWQHNGEKVKAEEGGKPWYHGVVLGADGKLYFVPWNAKHLLSIGQRQPQPENRVLSPLFNKL